MGLTKKLDAKKNYDLSSLPPPEVCLREHVKRVNYQVAIWKRGHVQNPEIPSPTDDNGWVMVNWKIEPKWYEGSSGPKDQNTLLPTYAILTTGLNECEYYSGRVEGAF